MAIAFGSISTVATSGIGGNLTLNAPASGAEGDLYVACIGYRSNAAFTPPSGWTQVRVENTGDADSTDGIASGGMWWIIRGASEPSFAFTRTGGDVATGYVVRFTGSFDANSLDQQTGVTAGSIATTAVATGFTTTAACHIIAMLVEGDNDGTMTSIVAATNPTSMTERADAGSNTGADVHLGVAEAAGPTSSATGNFTGTQSQSSRMVLIAAAFKEAAAADRTFDATLAAQAAAISAAVEVVIEVDGALAAQAAALAATVEVQVEADAALAAQASDLDATVEVIVEADAALAAAAATLASTVEVVISVSGDLVAGASALAAEVGLTPDQITFNAALAAAEATLSATVAVAVTFSAALAAQPAALSSEAHLIPGPGPEVRVKWNQKGTMYRTYVLRR